MKPVEAARVLYQNGASDQSRQLLEHLWNSPELRGGDEFSIFCGLVEVWASANSGSVMGFLDSVISGEGELQSFWERRTMDEQSTLLDWHGQFAYASGDHATAFGSLTRAASLGRDTSIIWRLIGAIHIENEELEIGLRYIRRSLQLYRQLELDLTSGRENPLGFFTGKHPLGLTHGTEDFLNILLSITRLAKTQKNLRVVRELVVEMIHQYPDDERLMKVRLMLEKAIVHGAVLPSMKDGASRAQTGLVLPKPDPATSRPQPAVAKPRGFAALFRA